MRKWDEPLDRILSPTRGGQGCFVKAAGEVLLRLLPCNARCRGPPPTRSPRLSVLLQRMR